MKIITICTFITMLTLLLNFEAGQAQFSGGEGRGDTIHEFKYIYPHQFSGGEGRGDSMHEFKNFYSASIAEGAGDGWRFLSTPIATTYGTLLDPIWTQGAIGSNHPGSNQHNIKTFNGTDYVNVTDMADSIDPGDGFAVFVFAQDIHNDPTSANWPKTLRVTGEVPAGPVSITINGGNDTFSLVGNPYGSSIQLDGFTRNDVRNQIFVYDHNFTSGFDQGDDAAAVGGGGWRTWNGTAGSLTGGRVAPFQGFFVRNEASVGTPSLTIPSSASTTDGATFYNMDEPIALQIAARINNAQVSDSWLSFTQDGTFGVNENDVISLFPLDSRAFLHMYIENEGEGYDIKNLPSELGESVNLPVHINAWKPFEGSYVPISGDVKMIWPVMQNIPHNWIITLTDNVTGNVIDLKETDSYEFTLNANKSRQTLEYKMAIRTTQITEKFANRLTLTINPTTTSAPIDSELPKVIALNQNYPNPFNPNTQISYDLPQTANVRLDVFNIQGQRVATLVNAAQNAGSYNITFNATHLASGVYLYRLQAGATVLIKKMTLVK